MVEYRNRYGDKYTFTKQKDGNVLWEGDFEYIRSGDDFIDSHFSISFNISEYFLFCMLFSFLVIKSN